MHRRFYRTDRAAHGQQAGPPDRAITGTPHCIMTDEKIYRISFYNQGDIYELYAREIHQGNMYAFLEIEGIIFGERSAIVVDPGEEKLKTEFQGVTRTYIPLQAVIRIDEVDREGSNKIIAAGSHKGNIMPFPQPPSQHRSD
jgi:hypothetical protein